MQLAVNGGGMKMGGSTYEYWWVLVLFAAAAAGGATRPNPMRPLLTAIAVAAALFAFHAMVHAS